MSFKFKKIMAKMKQKLGFSLVEMLVVVAIIAILVSIITPMIAASTTKANAATNAANLRSVKGQLSTLMLTGDIDFSNAQSSNSVVQGLNNAMSSTTNSTYKFVLGLIKQVLETMSYGANTFYAENERITIGDVSYHAPAAKAINVDGLKIRAGTEMTVTIENDTLLCTYAGVPIEIFAIIAEDGDSASMSNYKHHYVDSNGDGQCDTCGKDIGWREIHSTDDIIGGFGSNNHTCVDADNDHVCDEPSCREDFLGHSDSGSDGDHNCDKTNCPSPNNVTSCSDGVIIDYNCDDCGKVLDHQHYDLSPVDGICDVNKCGETVTCNHTDTNPKDHKCDNCEEVLSSCSHSGMLKRGTCSHCGYGNDWWNGQDCPNC